MHFCDLNHQISGVGGEGARAAQKFCFVENPGKIPKNLGKLPENTGKNGTQRCLI